MHLYAFCTTHYNISLYFSKQMRMDYNRYPGSGDILIMIDNYA